jgi:hypothetical protein
MPAASVSNASPSRSSRVAPSVVAGVPRVRWDRLGRIAMLCVMVAVVYLYLSAGTRLFSSWRESGRDSAHVHALESQNRILHNKHAALANPGTVQAEARRLGMIHPGEQAYIVSGLPPN